MDDNFLILFPYWLLVTLVIGSQIYIRRCIIIPTLKKHGRDYQEYWSIKKKKRQFEEYVDICKQNRLPDIYWKWMKFSQKAAIVLVIGWLFLLFFCVGHPK